MSHGEPLGPDMRDNNLAPFPIQRRRVSFYTPARDDARTAEDVADALAKARIAVIGTIEVSQ